MNRNTEGVLESGAASSSVIERPGMVGSLLRHAGIVLAATAFIAICAHVAVPLWFTPVPVTLQPFAVLLLGLLLSPQTAAVTMAAYLLEGAAGMPVFAPHGLGGVVQLLGPTGGYLLSYPLVAPMVSWLWQGGARSVARGLWIAGTGSLVTLAIGAVWLGVLTHAAPMTLLNHAVLPFLPGDALKVCAAAGIAAGISRRQRKNGATA